MRDETVFFTELLTPAQQKTLSEQLIFDIWVVQQEVGE